MLAESLLLCLLLSPARGIMFELGPRERRCLLEGVRGGDLVTGEYGASDLPGLSVALVVRDAAGHVLAQRSGVGKGRFTVSTESEDVLEVCFESVRGEGYRHGPGAHEVTLSLRASDGNLTEAIRESLEALQPMERLLQECERLAGTAVLDFEQMRRREAAMRDTNLSTTNRVFYIALFGVFVLSAASAWQVLYLRRYFKSRKLI